MKRLAVVALLIVSAAVYSGLALGPAAARPAANAAPMEVMKTPWLQGVTFTSIYVLFETVTPAPPAWVEYGVTDKYGLRVAAQNAQPTGNGAGVVHNIKLSRLKPNTLYHYRVRHGTFTTEDYTFKTAPLPGTPARWCNTGDVHTNPDVHDAMAKTIASVNPGLVTITGDIIRNGTGYAEWRGTWFTPGQMKIMTTIPWVEAYGNHDYLEKGSFRAKVFEQDPDGTDKGYFSFDYGDSHIAVMKFGWEKLTEGDAQWKWIRADLAATKRAWKFVVFHHPAHSYGGHGPDTTSINLTTKVLEPARVDFVLAGHQHFYQTVLVNGIYHVVTVMCGGLRDPEPVPAGKPGKITAMEKAYSFVQIDTTPTEVTVTAKRVDGTVIETITKTKKGAKPKAPATAPATQPAPATAPAPASDDGPAFDPDAAPK